MKHRFAKALKDFAWDLELVRDLSEEGGRVD
jgi:hypothetical protein